MSALGFSTRQLHAGDEDDGPHRPRATPIHLTAGFVFEDFDQAHSRFAGTDEGFSYTRVGNPTNAAVERRIADLESGSGALLVSTGQAAVATTILALVNAGDHVLSSSSIYEGTRELLRDDLARLGVEGGLRERPERRRGLGGRYPPEHPARKCRRADSSAVRPPMGTRPSMSTSPPSSRTVDRCCTSSALSPRGTASRRSWGGAPSR